MADLCIKCAIQGVRTPLPCPIHSTNGEARQGSQSSSSLTGHSEVVPLNDGGMQMELHVAGLDLEVEFDADAKPERNDCHGWRRDARWHELHPAELSTFLGLGV